jgi:hypothetical protein
MFYFQQLLNQGLAGIDRMSLIPAVTGIAYTILLVAFLIGIYQAAMRGGDLQALAVTAIKYLVIAMILANWSTVFREVNGSFFQVAQAIRDSAGAGDVFTSWLDQLKQQFDANGAKAIWTVITGAQAAGITILLTVVAYLLLFALCRCADRVWVLLCALWLHPVCSRAIGAGFVAHRGGWATGQDLCHQSHDLEFVGHSLRHHRGSDLGHSGQPDHGPAGFQRLYSRKSGLDPAGSDQHLLCPGADADSFHCQENHLRGRWIVRRGHGQGSSHGGRSRAFGWNRFCGWRQQCRRK